jgi:hypothetical protein
MSFASAGLLWYLVPFFAAIIFLYLLRMRRKEFKVPASFLWPQNTTDVRANAPIQKLRFSWLMVLQLLAVALIIASLARPQTRQEGLVGNITVFVVDTSASMQAKDVGGSRISEAVSRIKRAISTAKPGDRFSLVEAGPTPRVAMALTGDVSRMNRTLDELNPTDAKTDVGAAMRLAAALVGAMDSGHIVLLSDGAFPEIQNFSQGKAAVHFQKIGDSSDNVAITAIGVGDSPTGMQLFCGLKNYSNEPKEVTLTLYADGSVFEAKVVTVPAKQAIGESAGVPAGAGVLEARIEPDDLLSSDNQAFALTSPGSSLRVLLISNGNLFLERALALDARVSLEVATAVPESEKAGSPGASSYDIIVFDGGAETRVKANGILSFGSQNSSIGAIAGTVSRPQALAANEEDEVTKFVDLSSTFIDKANKVTPAAGSRTLVDSDRGPLILASDVDKKHVYVGFSLLESDFPLQVGFPIFISNVLDFVAKESKGGAVAIQTGRTVSLVAETPERGRLTLPNGSSIDIEPDVGSYVLRTMGAAGKYVFSAAGKQSVFYANLLDEEESNITPSESLSVNNREVAAAKAPARIADFWKPILLLCLLILAGEWWLFAKRS